MPVPPVRHPLAFLPTPLHRLDRLGAAVGFAPGALWMKRDDCTGLAGGGNKARKLEYLVSDALGAGCDVLLTGGAAQSNHVRMTAAAARAAGLDCVAVLGGTPPDRDEGNLVLDRLFGAELVWVGEYDAGAIERVLAETAMRVAGEGRRPYEIPMGGASAVGTLGYVVAAGEILAEAPVGSVVYTATGTGGTQAGLVVGIGAPERVRGVDVGALADVGARMRELIPGVASLARRPLPSGPLVLDRSQVGDGYGARTDAAREAIELVARTEGIVLDPVYSGKAMAGLIADRRADRIAADDPVVFLHTGGLPGLLTERYAGWLGS